MECAGLSHEQDSFRFVVNRNNSFYIVQQSWEVKRVCGSLNQKHFWPPCVLITVKLDTWSLSAGVIFMGPLGVLCCVLSLDRRVLNTIGPFFRDIQYLLTAKLRFTCMSQQCSSDAE